MNDRSLELAALGFQALCTAALCAVHLGLWRTRRHEFHRLWSIAWGFYALRLVFISLFLLGRRPVWLFLHETVVGWAALLLLEAALRFDQRAPGRAAQVAAILVPPAWAAIAVFGIRSYAVGGASSALLLAAVTAWTSAVFFRRAHRRPSLGARVLAWTFAVWTLHHLDYPLLRPQGAALVLGVFVDVGLIIATAVGALTLVLGEEREALAQRSAQLEQLSRQLLRAQEEERRRIARELHDEVGQTLTALKIDLDLAGRHDASALAGRALAQVREVSELLRPRALDDLGLVPALRMMAEDFARHAQLDVRIEAPEQATWSPAAAVAIFRVTQEALTNVARHAGARRASVDLAHDGRAARVAIEDDGRGPDANGVVAHLGLLGMRERVTALGGTLSFGRSAAGGLRVEAIVPLEGSA